MLDGKLNQFAMFCQVTVADSPVVPTITIPWSFGDMPLDQLFQAVLIETAVRHTLA